MKKIKSLFRLPVFIARKYLFSRGEPRFTSFLTVVAICGVAIGISALITVISVMAGFTNDLESKLMGFNPHVTVTFPGVGSPEIAQSIESNFEGIKEIDGFATGEVIVQSVGGEDVNAMGAKVLGIERIPERMYKNAKFYWGGGIYSLPWWHMLAPPLEQGVVLGNEMLYQVGVFPDFGDRVHLISPFGGIDPFGNPIPKRREYRVLGGFKSGFFEYDVKYVLMSLSEAKQLLGTQGRYGLQIMLDRADRVPQFVAGVEKFLGPEYSVTAWTKKNKRLFAALKLERVAMTFLLSLIIIIASFSIVGVILMIFFSKRRDLATLMAVGASRKRIEKIFLVHGGLIGLAGAILGSALGLMACYIIQRSNIVLPPSYYLDYLPVSVDGVRVLFMALGGVVIAVLAAYYPARRAAATDPVELLRSE